MCIFNGIFPKNFSFRGDFVPQTPTGALPLDPAGTTSPTPLHCAPGKLLDLKYFPHILQPQQGAYY